MTRNALEALFLCLICVQFAFIALHDWITVPGWVNGRQVQAIVGRKKLAWATLVNLFFPATAVAFAFVFLHDSKPRFVLNYWVIYTGITVTSAFLMWWVPYWFGSEPKRLEEYQKMYAGTRHVLPVRRGDVGPNLLHIGFHALFVCTLLLAVALRLQG